MFALAKKPLAECINIAELLEALVDLSDEFSGAEINEACRQALWEAIRDSNYDAENTKLTWDHLKKSIGNIRQAKSLLS